MALTANRIWLLGRQAFPRALSVRTIVHTARVFSNDESKVTHTGQAFEADDYRNVRYIQRDKEVNDMFAIDLINDIPPKEIHGRSTHCDGGGGALGHPKVFINLDSDGPHACGYCGLRFVQAHH